MKTLTIRTRHLIAMVAIAISTSAIASAQYTFIKVKVPGSSGTSERNQQQQHDRGGVRDLFGILRVHLQSDHQYVENSHQ